MSVLPLPVTVTGYCLPFFVAVMTMLPVTFFTV